MSYDIKMPVLVLASSSQPFLRYKRALCEEFLGVRRCCITGLARQLRDLLDSAETMLSEDWQATWAVLARYVTMTIAEIENRHSRNRRRCSDKSEWSLFVANFTNQEAGVEHSASYCSKRITITPHN